MNKKTDTPRTPDELASPKGMRDLIGDDLYALQGFFEKAAEVAVYYGFKPIETPIMEREEVFTSGVGEETDIVQKEMYSVKTKGNTALVMRPEGTAGIMRAYLEHGMHTLPQPVQLYYHGPFFRHERPQRGRWRQLYQFGLESFGSEKSIADALIIKMMVIILTEAGIANAYVKINSIGDKDCRPAYIRALTAYYKKHLGDVCADCRQRIKTNPLRLLDCKNEVCIPIKRNAPEMVSYLCEPCKKHFKEVLEYLDTSKTPYVIDHTLVRGLDYYTRTVFEFFSEPDPAEERAMTKEPDPAMASSAEKEPATPPKEKGKEPSSEVSVHAISLGGGGRYDGLARQLGSRRDTPSVGAALGADRIMTHPAFTAHPPRIIKKPKIYFIQIGFDAKQKSFDVIEILRKAKIPVHHSLSKDKLSVQLAIAQKMEIPYTIILGQKEVIDGTIIVRDMHSHSQATVPIDKLAEYLKKK